MKDLSFFLLVIVSLSVGHSTTHAQLAYEFVFDLSGATPTEAPGLVANGDPLVGGTAEMTIYSNNTMDYNIELEDDRYRVTQAHFYNMNKTSGTSGNPDHGDSIICWGGRWASGGDSDDYLIGTGYSNGRLDEVVADPTSWFLIIHTEGGHFANDSGGLLIPYIDDPSGPQETSVTGVPESEREKRFNNRVGKTLLDLVLRVDNDHDPAAPFYSPTEPENLNDTPFADANGNMWVEPDGANGWQLTSEAITQGYDLETEYLFYLYDDQGPSWDFGGPEGALGGFLSPAVTMNGDLNTDDVVDVNDWTTFAAVYGNDLGGLTPVQAYLNGDINQDGLHSLADIRLFRELLTQAGVTSSQLRLVSVPEPSSMWSMVIVVVFMVSSLTTRSLAENVS